MTVSVSLSKVRSITPDFDIPAIDIAGVAVHVRIRCTGCVSSYHTHSGT